MNLIIRVDLKPYSLLIPEQAESFNRQTIMLARLLHFSKRQGIRLQIFTNRLFAHAMPAAIESLVDERHDIDFLASETQNISNEYQQFSHEIFSYQAIVKGIASQKNILPVPPDCQFIITNSQPQIKTTECLSLNQWLHSGEEFLNQKNQVATLQITPESLFRVDPDCHGLRQLTGYAKNNGYLLTTFRQISLDLLR